ncbi:hypothetical protein DPMN_178154 [Dreissena polymorpha]|uniref:Uncharacterized protein n=1 Tax=Dreissena polymorpha TaxID=45954 RepID=A0A9D4B5L6_DREPO|nr:hypothetical protein DPMN_193733 [Dreissena polymorpha]KAH3776722.1 hypothetical protein DPMN_178154 [Dreissena polymorpha]
MELLSRSALAEYRIISRVETVVNKKHFKSRQLPLLPKACNVAETLHEGKCKRRKWSLFRLCKNHTLRIQLSVHPAVPAAGRPYQTVATARRIPLQQI